jgi:hypothetical protein
MTTPISTADDRPFMVGEIVPGYCGGLFPLDTYDDELRVEAVGVDWVVLRDVRDGTTHFYSGDHAKLRYRVAVRRSDEAANAQ